MNSYLPIGIDALLSGAVETSRLECKASWDPNTTGWQVIKSLCAFANDLQNLNGGYVLLGVAEEHGSLVRPVQGLSPEAMDAAQKWISGHCQQIDPVYMPVFDVAKIDDQRILVIWAPASETRPHRAPDGPKGESRFWVRVASTTRVAKDELLTMLMQQTARVPFDDRRNANASNADLSITLVRQFLHDVRSELRDEADAERVYRAMQIVSPSNGRTVPRNIGLLFFSNEPRRWFRGARIEVVEFPQEAGGNVQAERIFEGPLHEQIRQCLGHLESLTTRQLEKQDASVEVRGWISFPLPALREAVVNAMYHRSYEDSVEPTKVYLYPDRVEVISYPGPVAGIELCHLEGAAVPPPVPARNRRIGELLKELRLAESRGTGLPKMRNTMRENGSPPPRFDFDEGRSYFRVTLPAHPEYVVLSLLRDYAYAKVTGDALRAQQLLSQAWNDGLRSDSLLLALVRDAIERRDLSGADRWVAEIAAPESSVQTRALTLLAAAYSDAGDDQRSKDLLNRLPELMAPRDAFEAAILERRVGRDDRAHRLFERAGDLVLRDARALHEFAQSKLQLTAPFQKGRPGPQTRQRLLKEALAFLERVVQMEAPPIRHAWAWYNTGQAREWLKCPLKDVINAYQRALALDPQNVRFKESLLKAQKQRG